MNTLNNSMLKNRKKGFTLTELAIVIAVIAILIAVLVPTFSSIITKARVSNESVACSNEWTNFSIDAGVATSGSTTDDYLVVYTGNTYTENSTPYYHGYLATDGVYDSSTSYNVTISASDIATCDGASYKPIGTYEYMASGKIVIYTNKATTSAKTATTFTGTVGSVTATVTNEDITISGYDDTYYVTGTLGDNETAAKDIFGSSSGVTTVFYIRIYFPVAPTSITGLVKTQVDSNNKSEADGDLKYYGSVSGLSDSYKQASSSIGDAIDNYSNGDDYAYVDCFLKGSYKKFVFDYYTSAGLAGTITVYNNAN